MLSSGVLGSADRDGEEDVFWKDQHRLAEPKSVISVERMDLSHLVPKFFPLVQFEGVLYVQKSVTLPVKQTSGLVLFRFKTFALI